MGFLDSVAQALFMVTKGDKIKKLATMNGITNEEQERLFELALKRDASSADEMRWNRLVKTYKSRGAYFAYDAQGNLKEAPSQQDKMESESEKSAMRPRKFYDNDEVSIETGFGTMLAQPWHVDRHIALDPSGFNWRMKELSDFDKLINVLKNGGVANFQEGRQDIVVTTRPTGEVYILAKDIAIRGAETHTLITPAGRQQLLEIVKAVAEREIYE